MNRETTICFVTILVSITLSLVMVSMVGVFLYGLFVPNGVVSNDDIFPIIGPAFNTIVGGFIGILAAVKVTEHIEK
jgi:hypothetical protein